MNVTPSSTNQLLKTMVDSGHLTFNAGSKEYRPSPRLAEFSAWMVSLYGSEDRLRQLIRFVEAELGMVATLSTPNDLFMQIMDSVIPLGRSAERGLQISIFGSAIGSAYLGTLDHAEIAKLAYRARLPDEQVATSLAEIDEVRRVGFAQGGTLDEHLWSLAMPIPPGRTQVPMVLGLAGSKTALHARVEEVVAVMRDAITRYV